MSRADEHYEMDEWLGRHSLNYNKIMIVEFNTGGASYIPVQQTSTRRTQASSSNDDSSVSFSSQSLQDTLKQSSSVRPEKVAQAGALLSDGNYPSDADLNRLAGFLANRL
jgi:anti-sigma28 factor (negative regulator of flagellin synthesis)